MKREKPPAISTELAAKTAGYVLPAASKFHHQPDACRIKIYTGILPLTGKRTSVYAAADALKYLESLTISSTGHHGVEIRLILPFNTIAFQVIPEQGKLMSLVSRFSEKARPPVEWMGITQVSEGKTLLKTGTGSFVELPEGSIVHSPFVLPPLPCTPEGVPEGIRLSEKAVMIASSSDIPLSRNASYGIPKTNGWA